jgi:phenylpropionate dioxygenase-like ring-hydroxylating dioxygenase large terminal subunit
MSKAALDAQSTPPLRDAWYYALPSERLKIGDMVPKTMLEEPLIIGRDKQGKAFALLDICPHRGIPLRFGKFDGCEVECCYHGWRFAPSGVCTDIPTLVDEQKPELSKVKVKAYPVQEVQGGIWVFFGENLEAAPPVPVLPELDGAKPKMVQTMMFDGAIDHAVVGLVDPAHATFIHKAWFWRSTKSIRNKAKQFAPSPFGFTMVRHPPSSNSRAYKALGGKPETEIVFQLPGVRYEHIKVGRHVMCHLTTLTPVSGFETEINHSIFWTMPWLTPLRPLFWPFVRTFLRQDRDVISQQQLGLQYNPQLLLLGDPDVQARWYFRLKNEYVRAQEEKRPFVNPIKPRVLQWRS